MAQLCRLAGADEQAIPAWGEEGKRRAEARRLPPFSQPRLRTWTYLHRRGLRIGAVALAALIFVFRGEPTVLFVIVLAILLLIVLGLIELIGRPPPSPG